MKYIFLLFVVLYPLSVKTSEIIIDDYTNGLSDRWEKKSFNGDTEYRITREDGRLCIMAESKSSASGLFYKIDYDLDEYPIITWQWKISNVISGADAMKKEGDDYAARLYIVFPSLIFWKTHTLNYIWANNLEIGTAIENPYTKNAIMIAVENGAEYTGKWKSETRNVLEDYRKHFKKEPPHVGAIAIMTDTDNTGDEAVAWYGVIKIIEK